MALDRQTIEKKDFPVGRRGYDPDAVDAHLAALADELTEFKRSSRRRADTLASSASDQVRAIVEAAENSAADIQGEAETEAREIREEANSEAKSTREEASEQAREYVSKVSESTAAMLQRIDAMESELSSLVDALRTGGNRLDSDLRLLEGNLTEVGKAATPHRYDFEPESPESPEPAAAGWGAGTDGDDDELYDPEAADGDAVAPRVGAEEAIGVPEPLGGAQATVAELEPAGSGSSDAEGARLIALNMALNGSPRDETARYLSENFELVDSHGLLDEVYASVEG
ncbi:MAG: DivIVA domain-containing protein [Actinomycetota bacterium]|nr:DivIVA domain-containing protein [Actinomycetota bacterium]